MSNFTLSQAFNKCPAFKSVQATNFKLYIYFFHPNLYSKEQNSSEFEICLYFEILKLTMLKLVLKKKGGMLSTNGSTPSIAGIVSLVN